MSSGVVLLRHQANAIAATLLDFSVMIALVSGAGLPPALGTALGAASGGVLNFFVGRLWVFSATQHKTAPQLGRYAFVSFASLLLNAGGVHALAGLWHLPYVAARVGVAFAVSVFWNFPMHRSFVFGARAL